MEREKGAVTIDEEEQLGIKLRRGIAVGKRGGPCTPVPAWKFEDSGSEGPDSLDRPARQRGAGPVSARKLGAGLWEVQEVLPLSRMSRRAAHPRGHREPLPDVLPPANPPYQPQSAGSLRRHVAASSIQHHKLNERYSQAMQPVSPTYSSSMEVARFHQATSPSSSVDLKGRLGESGYSIKTSTELLKVLNRIWSLEEQHTSNRSQMKALKVELENAHARIRELIHDQRAYRREMDDLMNQVAEDKAIRKNKEQDRIKAAVRSMREELEDERRLRRHSENLHRKLGKELSEVKASYSKALKANSLLEDLCDEFAKGVRDYEQEVRELKQKTETDFENPRTDRVVLHISEAWLDERLQMQNAEAQGDEAERSTVINRLSSEIKTFLQARDSTSYKKDGSLRRQSLESVYLNGAVSAPQAGEDDDSVASDLHCFELNVIADNNGSQCQLNPNCEDGREKIESVRKSNSAKKKMGYSEKNKGHSSSGLQVQFEEKNERTKSCNGMHGLDQIQSQLCEGGKVHHDNHHGDESHNRFSWRSHFVPIGEEDASVDFQNLSSPVQRWNFQHISPDLEISECSSRLPNGVKDNTLKAKLLEARLEGKHARLKVSKGSSVG